MENSGHWFRETVRTVREHEFARDAREEFLELSDNKGFMDWVDKLEPNQPNLINSQDMIVILYDLGKSNKTRAVFGEDVRTISVDRPYALLEDLVMMKVVGKIAEESFTKNDGTNLGIESGDMGKICYGAMPFFKNFDENVERALVAVDDFKVRLIHEGSNGYKTLVAAEEIDRQIRNGTLESIDALTEDGFLKRAYSAEKLLGRVSETFRDSHIQVSMGMGIGPNKCTITKILQSAGPIKFNIPKIEINGIGAVQAGRAEAAAENGKVIVSPVTPELFVLDEEKYLTQPISQIKTKDGSIWAQEFRGVRVFNNPTFYGRIPEDSYIVKSGMLKPSKAYVKDRADLLTKIQEYHPVRIDCPQLEREDPIYHGDSLMTATLVAMMAIEGAYSIGSQDEDKGLSMEEAVDSALTRNVGRYHSGHVVLNTGFVNYDFEARRRAEAKHAEIILSEVEAYKNSNIPAYAGAALMPFDESRSKFGEKVAYGLRGIDMVEKWFDLVSPRSHSFKMSHEEAFANIDNQYTGSPMLPIFNRVMRPG